MHSALFDQVRTCDNHCEFCFIYQLPPGLRKSLYQKDDDYRLSFLYGNFTTLTRFTEADLERVITEGLSPLNVSIHATDPDVRSDLLRNRRGATSLRWLRALLDHGVAVHGQVVVCPGLNDGAVLDDTLAGVLDRYPELASLCVVPLGLSRYNTEPRMRPHTAAEAAAVVDCVEGWQELFLTVLGPPSRVRQRRVLPAGRSALPGGRRPTRASRCTRTASAWAAPSSSSCSATKPDAAGVEAGFFAWADASRRPATGAGSDSAAVDHRPSTSRTAACGPPRASSCRCGRRAGRRWASSPAPSAPRCWRPLVERLDRDDVRIVPVDNEFFGGTTSVTGLLVGRGPRPGPRRPSPRATATCCPTSACPTVASSTAAVPRTCPAPVEVVPTDGHALRRAPSDAVPGRP